MIHGKSGPIWVRPDEGARSSVIAQQPANGRSVRLGETSRDTVISLRCLLGVLSDIFYPNGGLLPCLFCVSDTELRTFFNALP